MNDHWTGSVFQPMSRQFVLGGMYRGTLGTGYGVQVLVMYYFHCTEYGVQV